MSDFFTYYVLGFYFSKDREQVLLIKKNKPAMLAGYLNGVGGKVEPGETSHQAMVREFKEEVGIETVKDDWRYRLSIVAPNYSIAVLTAEGNPHAARQMESEEPSVHSVYWLDTVQVVPNLRWMIPLLLDRELAETQQVYIR